MRVSAEKTSHAGNGISYSDLSGNSLSGLMMIILAFTANYDAIQKYNVKQMALGSAIADEQHKVALAKIAEMGGNDPAGYFDPNLSHEQQTNPMRAINCLVANAWRFTDKAALQLAMSKYTSDLNILNTQFNQTNTLYNGLVQGANQNSSDTTQTLQTALSMMGTNGVLATLQTIAQCV